MLLYHEINCCSCRFIVTKEQIKKHVSTVYHCGNDVARLSDARMEGLVHTFPGGCDPRCDPQGGAEMGSHSSQPLEC